MPKEKEKTKKTNYESQESLYQKAIAKLKADALIVQTAYKVKNYEQAARMFEEVGDYLDAPEKARECRRAVEEAKAEEQKKKYEVAVYQKKNAKTEDEWRRAAGAFSQLGDYLDAKEQAAQANTQAEQLAKKFRRKRAGILAVVMAAGILVLALRLTGTYRYFVGLVYMKAGNYETAGQMFSATSGFLNSDEAAEKCMLQSLLKSKVGKDVTYGKYRWKILSRKGTIVRLIASNIGESHPFYRVPFHSSRESVTWENASLRAWLNGDVLYTFFGPTEREHLVLQESAGTETLRYDTAYAETTQDYLTLLSTEEAVQPDCRKLLQDLGGSYWLRNPGYGMDRAVYIDSEHVVRESGAPVDDVNIMVRPVITVNCSMDYHAQEETFPEQKTVEEDVAEGKYAELLMAAVGKDVTFGTYRWKILSRDQDVVTLIASDISSSHPFYSVPFHEKEGDVTWAGSDLRKWLNGPILETIFDAQDRSMMVSQSCEGSANMVYGTAYSETTEDYLTILSSQETQLPKWKKLLEDLGHSWWLRTPGETMDTVAFMSHDHQLCLYGGVASGETMAVRPVIRVDCSRADQWTGSEENKEASLTVPERYRPLVETETGKNVPFGMFQWKLLNRQDGVVTLIAADIGEGHPFRSVTFDESAGEVTWENSRLRAWLNGEVLESAFSEEDRSLMMPQSSGSSENTAFGTAYPDTTEDYLTLLSVQETQSILYHSLMADLGLNWWLRTPGEDMGKVAYMGEDHTVHFAGSEAGESMTVRPVIKVDVKRAVGWEEPEEETLDLPEKYRQLQEKEIGKNVEFGKYQWKILNREDGLVTLIAAEISTDHPFRTAAFKKDGGETTWAESSLRAWLNEDILESIFSEEDRELLVPQKAGASENQQFHTAYFGETEDYLIILSAQETQSILYQSQIHDLGLNWWVRTPGESLDKIAYMDENHHLQYAGSEADNENMSVRPVITVDLRRAAAGGQR